MAKEYAKKENPLLSKNIPKAPALEEQPAEREVQRTEKNGEILQYGKAVKSTKTAKITIYPSQEQVDKLYDLMEAFRRRTGVKINQQDLIRRLIDLADPHSIIP